MSTPQSHRPPLEVRERSACMCAHDGACSTFAPGHALHLIQARLAAATPRDWADALVESVDAASGEITLRTLDGDAITVWNAGPAITASAPGSPVALHTRYAVLSSAGRTFNVARLD